MRIIKNWAARHTVGGASQNSSSALSCVCFALFFAVALAGCTPPGPRALLDGKRLLERGRHAEAIARLREATLLMQTNAVAWNYLGLAFHYAGQTTNAALAYERALRLDPDLREARFNLGNLWLEDDRPDLAKPHLVAYTLREPNSAQGWLRAGQAHLKLREWAAAEKCFNEALRRDSKNGEALNGLGLVELQRRRPREAAQRFAQALALDSQCAPAILNLAIVTHHHLNDRATALKVYRQYLALPERPSDWADVNNVAKTLEQELAPQPAQPAPVAASSNKPATSQPVVDSAPPVNVASQKVSEAAVASSTPVPSESNRVVQAPPARTENIRSERPPTTVPPENRVTTSIRDETVQPLPVKKPVEVVRVSPDPELKVARDVTASPGVAVVPPTSEPAASPDRLIVPNSSRQPERRGFLSRINPLNVFRREKSSDDVKPTVTAAGERLSDSDSSAPRQYSYQSPKPPRSGDRRAAEPSFVRGTQLQSSERLREAIEAYREAVRLDPAYFEAHYNLGLASASTGDVEGALRAYEMALAIRPDSVDARYNFAVVLKQGNYIVDSARELERILRTHPNEVRAHLILGNIFAQQLRQPNRAHAHYSKVLELDPNNAQAQAIRYWIASGNP